MKETEKMLKIKFTDMEIRTRDLPVAKLTPYPLT